MITSGLNLIKHVQFQDDLRTDIFSNLNWTTCTFCNVPLGHRRPAVLLFGGVVMEDVSSQARILGECSTIHSLPALFFFFFFEVETSLHMLIPLSMKGSVHSGSAS